MPNIVYFSRTADPVKCPPETYMPNIVFPSGTADPVKCPAATYMPNVGATQVSDCEDCPAGFYCDTDG